MDYRNTKDESKRKTHSLQSDWAKFWFFMQ